MPSLSSYLTPMVSLCYSQLAEYMLGEAKIIWPEFETVAIYEVLLRIVARISARVFVGPDLCRNDEWLNTSIHYTENVFMTVIALRMLPSFLHPIVVRFLPSWYRVHHNLRVAKKLIIPIVEKRLIDQAAGNPDYVKPNDTLQWMMDSAGPDDGKPYKLAHRQLLLSLGSIHTTTMSASHALYDLCAHPEFFKMMKEEVESVLIEDNGWTKTTLTKMKKVDSMLKESQRLNPPSLRKSSTQSLLSFKKQTLTQAQLRSIEFSKTTSPFMMV